MYLTKAVSLILFHLNGTVVSIGRNTCSIKMKQIFLRRYRDVKKCNCVKTHNISMILHEKSSLLYNIRDY